MPGALLLALAVDRGCRSRSCCWPVAACPGRSLAVGAPRARRSCSPSSAGPPRRTTSTALLLARARLPARRAARDRARPGTRRAPTTGPAESRARGSASRVPTGALFQYGLWGRDSSNEVRYLGERGDRGAFDEIAAAPSASPRSTRATSTTSSPPPPTTRTIPDSATPPDRIHLAQQGSEPRARRHPARRRLDPGRRAARVAAPARLERGSASRTPRPTERQADRWSWAAGCYLYGRELSARQRALPVGGGRPPPARALRRAPRGVAPGAGRRGGPRRAAAPDRRRPSRAAELADLYGRGHRLGLEAARWAMPEEAADLDPQASSTAPSSLYLRGAHRLLRRSRRPLSAGASRRRFARARSARARS